MSRGAPGGGSQPPPFLALSEDQLAELADLLCWLADDPENSPADYPGASWDDPDAREPWDAGDRWIPAPAE